MIENALELAQLNPGLDAETMAASHVVSQQLATSEWLGPLAPVALSPFFGLAALSGAATYGPEWLQERSALFSDESALNSPWLFWTMFTLAILTSLPRLTKVSKPLALAAENLEAYSAVIILIVVRFLGTSGVDGELEQALPAAVVAAPLAASWASLPLDVVMSIVAALNILVINGVKLFFEFMVWLMPFPTVDAMLEAGNKATCAALLALYAFSPVLACIVNLLILAVCAVVFGWTFRRLNYYREIVVGPVLAWLLPGLYSQRGKTFRAFSVAAFEGLPSYTLFHITQVSEDTFEIQGRWLFRARRARMGPCRVELLDGIVTNTFVLTTADGASHSFSHRRWVAADDLCGAVEPAGVKMV